MGKPKKLTSRLKPHRGDKKTALYPKRHRGPSHRKRHLHLGNRKSPLHASALMLHQIHVGTAIVIFHRLTGVLYEGVVCSSPSVGIYRHQLAVRLKNGKKVMMFLVDAGIIPHKSGVWNRYHFAVHPSKRHLLPEPNPTLPAPERYGLSGLLPLKDYSPAERRRRRLRLKGLRG